MKCGFVRNSRIWNAVETLQRGDFDLWSPQLGKFFSFRLLPSPFAKYLGKNDPQISSSIFMFCGFHVLAHAIKALSKLYLPTTPKANTFVINLISQILLNHKESSEDKTDCHCLKSGEKIEQCLLQQPQIEESTEKWCPRIWSQIGSKKQPTHPSAI